eukprot:TRINITY_DN11032_c0_g1_i1.p1 TRINITY_DN11032_c0_g1~~TRINITY_DN11032_c0_g1_i1.p1  ORF type:complete len:244 (-),score=45.18 TRINITY_DN11032_c0_g1_i1:72-803(-)
MYGTPLPVNEIKLVSVHEMDYLITDSPEPRGEIWIRGPNIFGGYFKMPDKTSEAIEPDGWFKTGDVGKWRLDGNLQIIDRKKNIFKLAQGEYIRPEHIENIYKMSRFCANAFVHGDSLETYLVAIIVPDFPMLEEWIKKNGFSDQGPDALCKNDSLNAFLQKELGKVGEAEGLLGFEHCRHITLVPDDFTVESDLLTPSMKLKRHAAKTCLQNEIVEMYSKPMQSKIISRKQKKKKEKKKKKK